jgi:hypothetical protein
MKVVGEPERGKPDFRFNEGVEGKTGRGDGAYIPLGKLDGKYSEP